MKVLVVGGGTAGLVAATILKRKLDIQVDVVRSKDIGIVGVGEGSTEQFKEYLDTIGIDQYHFIKNTNSTYKIGIVFDGWNPNRPYMHSIGLEFAEIAGQYHHILGHQISNEDHYLVAANNWENLINRWFLNKREEWVAHQFHFNTHMLNDFLTHVAEQLGCKIFDDEISEVVLKENGYIDRVKGEKRDYNYDFYVDATGFKRVLMTPLGAKWKSFSEYMKMNSAITFQTEHEGDNFPLWTLAKSMDSGWLFQLPTWDHLGNGYIFDKNYIDEDGAKSEVEKLFGTEVEIGKKFSFDPGHLENAWINNCVAVGLASAFVEPLEATSIGTSIEQSFLLSHKLINYNDHAIELYNKSFTSIMNNIRDFISLHYLSPRRDTDFWRDVSKMALPESMQEKLDYWKYKLPVSEDFAGESEYIMFTAGNFIQVMEGLDLFDTRAIKKEFMSQTKLVRDLAKKAVSDHREFLNNISVVRHKDFIALTRELFI
jgi:tryptophan halogenase